MSTGSLLLGMLLGLLLGLFACIAFLLWATNGDW